jgi:hypothetical protein
MEHIKNEKKIVERLDMVIRLLAHQISVQHQTIEAKAVALNSLGLKPVEIALVCGTTAATINSRLTEAKKKRAKKKS